MSNLSNACIRFSETDDFCGYLEKMEKQMGCPASATKISSTCTCPIKPVIQKNYSEKMPLSAILPAATLGAVSWMNNKLPYVYLYQRYAENWEYSLASHFIL